MISVLHPYAALKPSDGRWLGIMPEHWYVRRLCTVAEMRVSHVDKHTKDGEIPVRLCNYVDVYKNNRITQQLTFMLATASEDEVEKFRLHQNDVVITKDSETWDDIGVPALVTEPSNDLISGYHLAILRPRADTLGPFLFWALQSKPISYQFHVEAKGVTRYGLAHNGIQSVSLPVPPLEEQAAIVRFLDHADEQIQRYIASKERLIALLEEERQALVHQAVTRGLDPNVRLKPSGMEWLGEVPENWEIRRLRYLIQDKLKYGANAQAEFDNPDWPRYLRITDFTEDGRLREDNIRALPPEVAEEYLVEPGDILLARSGATVGKAFLVPTNPRRMCHAGYLIRARAEQSVIDPRFLFTFTQSHTFDRWLRWTPLLRQHEG